jgi:hypothetical protein
MGFERTIALDHLLQIFGIAVELVVQSNGAGTPRQPHGLTASRPGFVQPVGFDVHDDLTLKGFP